MAFHGIEDVFVLARRLARRSGAPHGSAEDVASQVVLELLGRTDITPALVGLRVRSRLVDVVRRERVRPIPIGLPREPVDEHGLVMADPGDLRLAEEPDQRPAPDALAHVDLARLLPRLPTRQREVLEAFYLRGLTPGEAARALGISRQSMNEVRRRALVSARQLLEPSGPAGRNGSSS